MCESCSIRIKKRIHKKNMLYFFIIILFLAFPKIYKNEYYKDNIYVRGSISELVLKDVDKCLNNIPEGIRDLFFSQFYNGKIIVTNENLQIYYPYEKTNIAGLFSSVEPEYLEIILTDKYNNYQYTIAHEFGHFIDYHYNRISCEKTFTDIFNREKIKFKESINSNEHYQKKSVEYFAQAYSYYVNDPEILKKYCPETYMYLKDSINFYSGYY